MQIATSKLLPRYIKLANQLQQQIDAGLLATGTKLPSQRTLAAQFDTTLMTIRRALEVLAQQGAVRIEHGVGTFVADQQLQENAFQLLSLNSAMRQRALATQTKVLGFQASIEHEQAAVALRLPAAQQLCLLERVRETNGTPFVLQRSFLPPQLQSVVSSYAENDSLYDLVQTATGQAVSNAKEYLLPTALTAAQADTLVAQQHEAAWLSVRVSSLQDGQAVIYDEAILRNDSLVLTVERSGAIAKSELKWRDAQSPELIRYLLDD